MFDKNLVDAIIGGEDPDGGSGELSLSLELMRGHGALLPDYNTLFVIMRSAIERAFGCVSQGLVVLEETPGSAKSRPVRV